jgi:preprotein translocase subunit SecG
LPRPVDTPYARGELKELFLPEFTKRAFVFYVLLFLLILNGFFLAVVVLLQSGKGGGLASMGGSGAGTDTLIGGRQAATLLTKATWASGGLFLVLALTLSILSTRSQTPQSILRDEFRQSTPTAPPPQLPGTQPTTPGAATTGATQQTPPPATTNR